MTQFSTPFNQALKEVEKMSKRPDYHSPRINGSFVIFPKRLSKTQNEPAGIIYHREGHDENICTSRKIWLSFPIYTVNAP